MWSEGFAAEERAARPMGASVLAAAISSAILAGGAVAVEVVFSVQVAAREMSTRGGSWAIGLLSLALGFAGPYAAIQTWHSPWRTGAQLPRRVARIATVTVTVAAIALAWLLLIHSGQRPPPTAE